MITRVDIRPDYVQGFVFTWELDPGFLQPGPYTFWVQNSDSAVGPFVDWSEPVVNGYHWLSGARVVAPKDHVLYFRVKAVVGPATHYSTVVQPYGDLNRREFLLARNIMRHETLQMRLMSGTDCKLYSKAVFGPQCTACIDFVSGESTTSNCTQCFGTGRDPGYHGPYCMRGAFSQARRDKNMTESQGVNENYGFQVRLLGTPAVKKDDVLIDTSTGKHYYINAVENVAEIRRIPLVQQAVVMEIPSSLPIYKVGHG